jgi:Zn ribbon nucleic-acid-binding protein
VLGAPPSPPVGGRRFGLPDEDETMEPLVVECLRCGSHRKLAPNPLRQANPDCLRCGYVGWAPVNALSEDERRAMRGRPLERRRLRLA